MDLLPQIDQIIDPFGWILRILDFWSQVHILANRGWWMGKGQNDIWIAQWTSQISANATPCEKCPEPVSICNVFSTVEIQVAARASQLRLYLLLIKIQRGTFRSHLDSSCLNGKSRPVSELEEVTLLEDQKIYLRHIILSLPLGFQSRWWWPMQYEGYNIWQTWLNLNSFCNVFRLLLTSFERGAVLLNWNLESIQPFDFWGMQEAEVEALEALQCLLSPPIMALTRPNGRYTIDIEAQKGSQVRLTTVAAVRNGKAVVYWSWSPNNGEQAYNKMKRKVLAVMWPVRLLWLYLEGLRCILWMHHNAIRGIMDMTHDMGKMELLQLRLSELQIDVYHRTGVTVKTLQLLVILMRGLSMNLVSFLSITTWYGWDNVSEFLVKEESIYWDLTNRSYTFHWIFQKIFASF